jgi:hypothetical protein
MHKKPTYWVRSKQINEIAGYGRWRIPAPFKTLEEANECRRVMHLRRGAYHPGYFVEVEDLPEREDPRLISWS